MIDEIPIELLLDYLTPKIKRKLPPSHKSPVVDKHLYGPDASPWLIFTEDDPWETITNEHDHHGKKMTRVVYAFTQLSRKSSKMISRRAGFGTWKAQTGDSVRDPENSSIVIGAKKMFTFKPDSGSGENSHWVMHEYSLAGDESDFVVCKITRIDSNCSGLVKTSSVVDDYLCGDHFLTAGQLVLGKRKFGEVSNSPHAQNNEYNNSVESMAAEALMELPSILVDEYNNIRDQSFDLPNAQEFMNEKFVIELNNNQNVGYAPIMTEVRSFEHQDLVDCADYYFCPNFETAPMIMTQEEEYFQQQQHNSVDDCGAEELMNCQVGEISGFIVNGMDDFNPSEFVGFDSTSDGSFWERIMQLTEEQLRGII